MKPFARILTIAAAVCICDAFVLPNLNFWGRSRLELRQSAARRPSPWEKRVTCAVVPPEAVKKIAVIGSGAVGLYYGARLVESGHDVSFLCRRDYEAIKTAGLQVQSCDGDVTFPAGSIKVFSRSEDIGPVDWVVLSLKSYSLPSAPDLVNPCIGPNTRILAIMNGYGIENTLAQSFGPNRIFGGMAFVCINRGEPGVVMHQKYGSILIGHYQDDLKELAEVSSLFEGSKVKVSTSQSLLCSRWDKLCWNIPFNGIAVAMGGITTDKIVQDPDLRELAHALMREVVVAANEDLDTAQVPKVHRLDQTEITSRMFSLTDTMGPYRPSTMIDLVEGRQMEVQYMFGNPLGRALELGCSVPHIESVVALIKAMQRMRHL